MSPIRKVFLATAVSIVLVLAILLVGMIDQRDRI